MAKDGRDPPEDVPSVVVLEAMQDQERKETEALIEGFDRLGRPTGSARPRRDFVDYYTSKTRAPPVVRSRTPLLRLALAWGSAAALMLLFGVTVAVLATPPQAPSSTAPAPPIVPSATTTITSAITPEPTRETVIVTAPSTSSRPMKPRTQATAASPPSTSKAAPRDDFLRDL